MTRSAYSPELGYIAAGFVRREFAESGMELWVAGDAEPISVEVRPMPLFRLD